MSSAVRKAHFSFALAVTVLVVQPIIVFCLMQTDREKGESPTRDVLEQILSFPSTVFDLVVRLLTRKSAAMVFGGFIADFYFGFILDAIVWSLFISSLWLLFQRLLPTRHLTSR